MVYTGGRLTTAKERVLVYLSDYRSYKGELEAPIEISQTRIAEATGITQANVDRTVRPLIEKEKVETHQVHVPGIRAKVNAYYLTSLGRTAAKDIKNRVKKMKIKAVDLDGNKTSTTIEKVQEVLPFEVNINDILRETDEGTFDCKSFLKHRNHAERLFFDQPSKFSGPRHFVGHEEELEKVFEWCDTPSSHTLVIRGIPGIGKTTFVAKMLEDAPRTTDIYCFSILPWTSLRSLLRELSGLMLEYGKRELRGYVDTDADIDLSEVEYVLTEGFTGKTIILVFDDFHNAGPELLDFFPMLHNVVVALPKAKLVVTGRKTEPFYDRKDVIKKLVLELTLKGLDSEGSISLAKAVGVPPELLESIYEQTAGHPLFIELLSQGGSNPRLDMEQYIAEELTKILKEEELELLKYCSIYRYPVHRRVFRSYQPALVRLVKHSILVQSPDDFILLHDVIKDALYGMLSGEELKAFHSNAAEHYLESSAVGSIIEAIHHLLHSDQVESAVKILLDREERMLKGGRMEDLAKILAIILSKPISLSAREKARLVLMQGTVLSFLGEWDDALEHYRQAGKLAKGNGALQMESSLGIAKILLKRNEYEEARILLESVLEWAKKNKELKMAAEVNYQLGSLYRRLANFELALKHFKNALMISKKLDDKHQLAKAHYGLGRIYHRNLEYEKALKSKNEALDIALQTRNEHIAAKILTSIGWSLTEIERIDEAIKTHERAIDFARKNGAVRVLAYALSNAGAVYIDIPDLNKSLKYLNEASDLFMSLGEKRMLATVKLNMATNSELRGTREEGRKHFNECIGILELLNDKNELMIAYFKFGQTLKKVDRSEAARKLLNKALLLSEKVGDSSASAQILKEIQNVD